MLTVVAVGVALLLQRRRPDPPSAPSYRAPTQLDRSDFLGEQSRFLVAVFASLTCETCPQAWAAVSEAVAGTADEVEAQRIDVQTDASLHQRYRIDGVPTTIIADAEGVVRQAFFGPITATDVAEALVAAGVGEPGPPPPVGGDDTAG